MTEISPMFDAARISILVYAVLVGVGGVMGFVKAQSKASLISGVVSAILLAACYLITSPERQIGLLLAAVVSILLLVVFSIRLAKTKKFMPSGMMLVMSLIEAAVLLCAINWSNLKF